MIMLTSCRWYSLGALNKAAALHILSQLKPGLMLYFGLKFMRVNKLHRQHRLDVY